MKNILITSAGRRVELVNAFKSELRTYLPYNHVYAIDIQPHLSAACQSADYSHACPRVTASEYIDFLLEYCLKYHIGLVIPTIDTELAILATNRDEFLHYGITLCISDLDLIKKCRDKRNTGHLFQNHGILYPEIYSPDNLKFPCFVKPYNGSCSIGAKFIKNKESIDSDLFLDNNMMFMEFIDKSYSEYTIDAYFDKNSQLKCLVPRKRLEIRAGEISKGITHKHFLYNELIKKISHITGAKGCLTIQFFVNEESEHYIGLEINPRFGGGYPLSYAAGANYPAWLIKEYLLNEPIEFDESWETNLLMLRYDAKVLVHDTPI